MRADAAPDVLMDVLNCYKVQEQCDAIRDALDDERRQTQRRMIAALYWRAGDAEVIGRAYHRAGGRGSMVTARSWLEASSALAHAARVMEAACPR